MGLWTADSVDALLTVQMIRKISCIALRVEVQPLKALEIASQRKQPCNDFHATSK